MNPANKNKMNTVANKPARVAELNNSWKGRGTLQNLVTELKRQKESCHDFVADVRHFNIETEKGKIFLAPKNVQAGEWLPDGRIQFNPKALAQLGEKCNPSIPKKFFDALVEARGPRLVELINGLHQDDPSKRLIRCLDGNVRAWLSNTYRILGNHDIAFECMAEAHKAQAQVLEASLSDTNMRIKFTTQQVWDSVDVVQRSGPQGGWFAGALGNKELQGQTILGATIRNELPGGPGTVHPIVTVSNSETGHGGFHVRIGILMGICFNVATLEDVVSQIHLGERMEEGVFTAETIAADSKVIMLKARDAVRAAFDTDKFKAMVAKAKNAQVDKIEKPISAVENIMEVGSINEEHKDALLSYFMQDYTPTRFGLAQAVSRLAQDLADGDEAYEMERLAGKIINNKQLTEVAA